MSLSVVFIRSQPGYGRDAPIPLGTKIPVPAGATVFLGRSSDADICMFDGSVARLHAMLAVTPDQLRLTVVDLGSSNGIHVQGKQQQVALLAPARSSGLRFATGSRS